MSDKEVQKTPAEAPEAEAAKYHQAKVGVKDKGEIVTSAAGETISGLIADITDGD